MTVFFPSAATWTRAPVELGYKPAASTKTPAAACSWLNFTIALIVSSVGILPASESLVAFKISMNFICNLPSECLGRRSSTGLTLTSNQQLKNRHDFKKISALLLLPLLHLFGHLDLLVQPLAWRKVFHLKKPAQLNFAVLARMR